MIFHNGRNTGNKIIQIPEQQIEIDAVVQRAVILQLPVMVAVFYIGCVFTQNLLTDILGDRGGAVEIDVVVRFFVEMVCCSGATSGDGFHLGQVRQFFEQLMDQEIASSMTKDREPTNRSLK